MEQPSNSLVIESKIDSPERLMSLQEAASMLHCHPNTLRNWDKIGLLKSVRVGVRKDRRYRASDVQKLISQI